MLSWFSLFFGSSPSIGRRISLISPPFMALEVLVFQLFERWTFSLPDPCFPPKSLRPFCVLRSTDFFSFQVPNSRQVIFWRGIFLLLVLSAPLLSSCPSGGRWFIFLSLPPLPLALYFSPIALSVLLPSPPFPSALPTSFLFRRTFLLALFPPLASFRSHVPTISFVPLPLRIVAPFWLPFYE